MIGAMLTLALVQDGDIEDAVRRLRHEIQRLESRLDTLQERLDRQEAPDDAQCPACGRPFEGGESLQYWIAPQGEGPWQMIEPAEGFEFRMIEPGEGEFQMIEPGEGEFRFEGQGIPGTPGFPGYFEYRIEPQDDEEMEFEYRIVPQEEEEEEEGHHHRRHRRHEPL